MTVLRAVPKPTRKRREEKRPTVKELVPLEEVEQSTVVGWLMAHKVLFSANVPDRRICKRMGYIPGIPDLMIYEPPPAYHAIKSVGVGLELKRKKGGVVSPEQMKWLEDLTKRGWICKVARGADEAIEFLEVCGYGGEK